MPKLKRHGQASVLSDSEYVKLLKQVKNTKHQLFILIGRYTGERWGAIRQLRVEDVYGRDGEPLTHITFRASTRKADPSGRKKTRQVPIHEQLATVLRGYRLEKGQQWLFPGRWPDKPMCFRNTDKFLRAAAEKAGLEGVSTHSTRRTLITRLDEAGVGLVTIQKITGHRDLRTLQRYVEIPDSRLKAAISLL